MKPIPVIKLMVWELIVDGGRWWRTTGFAVRVIALGLGLAFVFPVAAQEPDSSGQTNDMTAAEILSQLNAMAQGVDPTQPEDMAPSNDLTATNSLPQASVPAPGGDRPNRFIRPEGSNRSSGSSQSQNDDRRSRSRRSSRSKSDQPGGYGSASDYNSRGDRNQTNGVAGTNNGPVSLDYTAFKVIVDRNIFDPNRYPRKGPFVRPPPKSVDYVSLVGTMSYEKGTFAFFDGTSSDYKKALKLSDSIAGYKVTNITPNAVKLASGTNEIDLSVGAQLRREEDGPWRLSGQVVSFSATPTSTGTNGSASTSTGPGATSGGAESDIIKRLMQKRETQ